ncbi:MICOS complex subunit MIC60, partial [Tremellales sp. Uapishka_1]
DRIGVAHPWSSAKSATAPPPPQPKRKGSFRRFIIYTALGTLGFYSLGGYASTRSETFRDYFVEVPGGEAVADFADDHGWATPIRSVQGVFDGSSSKTVGSTVKDYQGAIKHKGEELKREADKAMTSLKRGEQSVAESISAKTEAVEKYIKGKTSAAGESLASSEQSLKDHAASAEKTLEGKTASAKKVVKENAAAAQKALEEKAASAKKTAASAQHTVEEKAASAKKTAASARHTVEEKASSAASAVKSGAHDLQSSLKDTASSLKEKAAEASGKVKALAHDASGKIAESTKAVPFNLSDGVEGIVREVEGALHKGESKTAELAHDARGLLRQAEDKAGEVAHDARGLLRQAEDKAGELVHDARGALQQGEAKAGELAHNAKDALTPAPGPRSLPDTQRPRELRPETVARPKPSFEGKTLYTGPPLPLGFEPPPGYYLAPPPVKKVEVVETLPLLVPQVKAFAAEEPIISQLASTIDSLTASLSTPTTSPSSDATGILSRAQDDLSALSKRLADVKAAEKTKLEQTVGEKKKEFEAVLRGKEAEWKKDEAGLKAGWEEEREKMVHGWRNTLEGELEDQREGIEKRYVGRIFKGLVPRADEWNRLREEVVSQGIELQRRWLRSIKTQVETERGGRLAKLDTLTTSLKHLERITLDNSTQLDDNVQVHKLWSALRAVQSKADAGDVAFESELHLLKSLVPSPDLLVGLEKSGVASTGIKSLSALSSWFTLSLLPKIQSASLLPAPEESSVLSHVASATLSKFMFRPTAGLVEGSDVGSILARAEYCLDRKDLDGAAREVNQLTGWPGKLAGDWLREARRRLEVDQALQVISTEATLASLLLV